MEYLLTLNFRHIANAFIYRRVRDVCARILGPLGVPIVFGAPVGHTMRPMLTLPLGVQARLYAHGQGVLEILEPAVTL